MPEANATAAILQAAAIKADDASQQLVYGQTNITLINVQMNQLKATIAEAQRDLRATITQIQESLRLAHASMAGTAQQAVIQAIGWLNKVDEDLTDDVSKLDHLTRELQTLSASISQLSLNQQEGNQFLTGAASNFRGAAGAL